jgi:hypothetical protein
MVGCDRGIEVDQGKPRIFLRYSARGGFAGFQSKDVKFLFGDRLFDTDHANCGRYGDGYVVRGRSKMAA